MTDDDVLEQRLSASAAERRRRVEELITAWGGPNLGTPDCPREARWAAVEPILGRGLPVGWTATEEQHIRGCSWCRKRVAFLSRGSAGTVAPAGSRPGVEDLIRGELNRLTQSAAGAVGWDRARRRWLRDQIYHAAVAADVVVTAADHHRFHQAFVAEVRALRRVSGQATVLAAADETARSGAREAVALLDAEEDVLRGLEADPKHAPAAYWYRCAEDAALGEDEIAGSEVPAETVRVAVHKVRAMVRAKLRPSA